MCFRCEFCGEATPPCTKPVLIVTETHEVQQRNGDITCEVKRERKACGECQILGIDPLPLGLVKSARREKEVSLEGLYEEDE